MVIGADSGDRFSYRLWEEPKCPDFVLEITSRTRYREDRGKKRELYRSLGVREYWQYDPTGDYLEPRLQGAELIAGEYRLAETDAAEERERQARQRAEQARQEAETRLAQEAVARQAAEARVAELEILLRQARGGDTGQKG